MTLLFFTSYFPYGHSETFIENEISILADNFDKVLLISMSGSGRRRSVPKNVEVVDLAGFLPKSTNYQSLYLNDFLVETFALISKAIKGKLNFYQFRYLLSLFKNYISKAEALKAFLEEEKSGDFVFYSYWFDGWATILALLKKKRVVDIFHTRAHGFDMYEAMSEYGFIPFRRLQLKEVTSVSAVSKAGLDYLIYKYPDYREKFHLHHLGVHDNGIAPFDKARKFTLVSCSNLASVKRVNLIVEILRHIHIPILWIHFGDGVQFDKIRKRAEELPENVEIDFRGRVANKEILNFYENHSVNLFITTSESEGGNPVSIQEAISFGIPVMGTNIGGIPEIVNANTGILIDKDFDTKETAARIEEFASSKLNSMDFRMEVRTFWKNNFHAGNNFNKFISEILTH